MPIGRAFETATVGWLVNTVATKSVLDFFCKWNIDTALLRKLQMLLLAVNGVLNHADERRVEDSQVEAWLHEVRDAAYDAEDLLDEISTDALESRLGAGQVRSFVFDSLNASDSVKAGVDFKLKDTVAALNPFEQRVESKLEKIIGRLEDIDKQKGALGLQARGGNSSNTLRRFVTTPSVDMSLVYGRGVEREQLIDLLVNGRADGCDDDNKFHVIPIVGIGGVGKTTLAQAVYGDTVVKGHFDFLAWACVSDDFDEAGILRSLIESLTQKTYDVKNLELLQGHVKTLLDKKKFLLVLDDVWNENAGNWQKLRVPFTAGAAGSRIIVTTRSKKVAAIMGTVPTYDLKELSTDDCWSLFEQIAFPGGNSEDYPDLKAIGKHIVEKCRGLPLAARVLGGLCLSELEKKSWERILHSKMWSLENSDILPALMLSYHHLPEYLKRCFAYCSIFPKDYEFKKEMLVLLWMAEGFLPQLNGYETNQTIEDEGSHYFSELVSRSFFQQCTGDNSSFVMHDLIHDLAQFVSGKTCLRLEDKMGIANVEKTRYLGYIRGMKDVFLRFEPISEAKFLRTFLPLDPLVGFCLSDLTNKVIHDVLPELRLLRVLSLSGYVITRLPDSMGKLRHLRYLNLSHSSIKELPESTSGLYNLQILILYRCRLLTVLPGGMGNLTNLRHLDITETDLKRMPPQMGRLVHLQTLSNFVVGKGGGSGINELKELVHIQGALVISGLDNVSASQDAIMAQLDTKDKLDELLLEWSSSKDRSPDVKIETEVLDRLQPHAKLKHLRIRYYGGEEFPAWMGGDSFSCLTDLHLFGCTNCTSLPSVGQLPSLKNLIIESMDAIKTIGDEFYKNDCSSCNPFLLLESLKFENMEGWEEWFSFGDGEVEGFPRLRELSIYRCPKLREFSHKFASLEKLSIKRCDALSEFSSVDDSRCEGFLRLRSLVLANCNMLHSLPNVLPSLEELEINDCEKIATLPSLEKLRTLELLGSDTEVLGSIIGLSSLTFLHINHVSNISRLPDGFLKRSTRLEELKIVGCGDLTSLSNQEMGLINLVSLRRLTISSCPKFAGLPDEKSKLAPSIESLDIKQCDVLNKLPSELYKLKFLGELRIEGCPKLEYFPDMGLPLSLKRLVIQCCGALKCIPENVLTYVEYLEIRACSSLKSIERDIPCHTTVKHVRLQNCNSLISLPKGLMSSFNKTLEFLEVDNCSSLEAFPSGELPASLKRLEVSSCANLQRLPASLLNLTSLELFEISDCPLFECFPEGGLPVNLRTLEVSRCESFNSLPKRIQSLKCLQKLCVSNCPNLVSSSRQLIPPGLCLLEIRYCEKLDPIQQWKLYKLTSLDALTLAGYPGLVSLPCECPLPRSITDLRIIDLPDLESLSEGLQNLTSLKSLHIRACSKLRSILPEKGLPSSLGILEIRQCPLLEARYQQGNGEERHEIENIPFVDLT